MPSVYSVIGRLQPSRERYDFLPHQRVHRNKSRNLNHRPNQIRPDHSLKQR